MTIKNWIASLSLIVLCACNNATDSDLARAQSTMNESNFIASNKVGIHAVLADAEQMDGLQLAERLTQLVKAATRPANLVEDARCEISLSGFRPVQGFTPFPGGEDFDAEDLYITGSLLCHAELEARPDLRNEAIYEVITNELSQRSGMVVKPIIRGLHPAVVGGNRVN